MSTHSLQPRGIKRLRMAQVRKTLNIYGAAVFFAFFPAAAYAQVPNLMSFDEALTQIADTVEPAVPRGFDVGIAQIDAPLPELADFFSRALLSRLSADGTSVVHTQGTSADFSPADLLNDLAAARVGRDIGAQVVLTGSFTRFRSFSQLSIRALDVRTSAVIAVISPRILNTDPILGEAARPLQTMKAPAVTEAGLASFNRGKAAYAEIRFDDALAEFTNVIAVNKDLQDAYTYRAGIYALKGDFNRAIADYTEALRFDPANTTLKAQLIAAYRDRGIAYYDTKAYDPAVADFTAGLNLDPANTTLKTRLAAAYRDRGAVFSDTGYYEQAVADFTGALEINPADAVALNGRSRAYVSIGAYTEALADYAAALNIDADTVAKDILPSAYRGRGMFFYNNGAYDAAVADFTAALEINPADTAALTFRGIAYGRNRDYDRAVADLTAALELTPEDGFVFNRRGCVYRLQGEYDLAAADFTEAVRLDPENRIYQQNLQSLPDVAPPEEPL